MGLPVVNYHFELQSFEPFQSTGSGKTEDVLYFEVHCRSFNVPE